MDFMGFRGGAGLYQSVGRRNGHVGGVAEVRAALALKSHSEAERRRRERINSHLSTLRRLIPNTSKMEKAALLAEVISQLRQLQTAAAEVRRRWNVPSDIDEITVEEGERVESSGSSSSTVRSIKATICCDDRPDLLADLKKALESILRLKTVSAEISTVGCRIRFVFILVTTRTSTTTSQEQEPAAGVITRSVQQTLKCALARISSSSSHRRRQNQPDFFSARNPRRISPLESSSSSS